MSFNCNQCNEERQDSEVRNTYSLNGLEFKVCCYCVTPPSSLEEAVNMGQRFIGNPVWFLPDGSINPEHPDYKP